MSYIGKYPRESHVCSSVQYTQSPTDQHRNTKTGIYLDAIYGSCTCRSIIESTPAPNAITELKAINRESTCQLSLAGDMICMLRDGLLGCPEVEKIVGEVEEAYFEVSPFPRFAEFTNQESRARYGQSRCPVRRSQPNVFSSVPALTPRPHPCINHLNPILQCSTWMNVCAAHICHPFFQRIPNRLSRSWATPTPASCAAGTFMTSLNPMSEISRYSISVGDPSGMQSTRTTASSSTILVSRAAQQNGRR